MRWGRSLLTALIALIFACPSSATNQISSPEIHFPEVEIQPLLATAGLQPAEEYDDLLRYTRLEGSYGSSIIRVVVVQVDWAYDKPAPDVAIISLSGNPESWTVRESRHSQMHPTTFGRLVENVVGAGSVIGDRGQSRGSIHVCSHAPTSRLDVRLSAQPRYYLVRGAHCDGDAPAMVAGELLLAAAEQAIRMGWRPSDR